MIASYDWLPMIGNDNALKFCRPEGGAENLGLVIALYNDVNITVPERSKALPDG